MNMNKLIAGGLMMASLMGGAANVADAVDMPVGVVKGRIAVVYFSWSPEGNTRFAAETIARRADARVFVIKPKKPYPTDYRACCDEAKPECYGKQLRPIQPVEGFDIAQYDVIFIGSPNWWGTMAPPVRTFVTQYASDFRNKTVCLFQTNGGGGMQRCESEFSELLSGHNILPAQAFLGSSIRNSIADLEKFVTDRVRIVSK